MRKIHKLLSFVFLFFLFSCYSSRIPNEVLRVIEEEDNNLCIMQGVEYKYKNTRKIYWECRLRIINQRISGEFDNYGYSLLYKRDFKRLRRIIKNRIKEEKEIGIAEINNSLEEKEHNYCIMLKNQSTKGSVVVYDYFKCREDLVKLRKGKNDFSDLSNEYLIKIFEYQDEEAPKESAILFVDKECIKYASDEDKLKKCKEALNEINKCSADIDNKIMQRRIDDKIFCTKMSINKYPDSLSKFDTNSNSNAVSFGPKMNKIDIVDLREKEFKNCYEERTLKISQYKEYLENQCKTNNLKTIK